MANQTGRLTARQELKTATFWWRLAFLVLWLAATLIITMFQPQASYANIVLVPLFGWMVFNKWPFDQIGLVAAGIGMCSFIGPGLALTLYDNGTLAANKSAVLPIMAAAVLGAMALGFAAGRWIAPIFD